MKWIISISLLTTAWILGCVTAYSEGERLYEVHCQACHMDNGEGLKKLFPPLRNADYLDGNFTSLPCIINYGLEDTIIVNGTAYSQPMQAIKGLTPADIANVMNFINKEFMDTQMEFVSPADVKSYLQECEPQ